MMNLKPVNDFVKKMLTNIIITFQKVTVIVLKEFHVK